MDYFTDISSLPMTYNGCISNNYNKNGGISYDNLPAELSGKKKSVSNSSYQNIMGFGPDISTINNTISLDDMLKPGTISPPVSSGNSVSSNTSSTDLGIVGSSMFSYDTLFGFLNQKVVTKSSSNSDSGNSGSSTPGTGMNSSAAAGSYGGVSLTQEQVNNAKIIAEVGVEMGMSQRDIQIAIMTAMQESGLRNINYGDRDSVGLFQQRPSCGWGTVAQCTDPRYAARKFFEHLQNVANRDSLSMNDAAYKVQRCAAEYKDRYGNWQEMAGALLA
jgi:hypothetical protein